LVLLYDFRSFGRFIGKQNKWLFISPSWAFSISPHFIGSKNFQILNEAVRINFSLVITDPYQDYLASLGGGLSLGHNYFGQYDNF